MKLLNYIKSFKTFIPTWLICIFMFFGVFGWTFVIGAALLIIQCLQRKQLFSKSENTEGTVLNHNKIINDKNAEISKLNETIKNLSKSEQLLNSKRIEISKLENELLELNEAFEQQVHEIDELNAYVNDLREKFPILPQDEAFILCAGKYKGGTDIPIGVYNLKVISGEGYFETNKPESVYENITSDSMDTFGYINEYRNLEISDKTILKINNSAKIQFTLTRQYDFSSEAQEQKEKFLKEFDSERRKYENELTTIKTELKILNDELIKKYYIFSNYNNTTSQDCQNELLLLKQKEKELRTNEKDVVIQHHTERSRKTEENIIRQMLRTFNSECDNIALNIASKNIDKARNQVQKSFDTINKLYLTDSAALTNALLKLKLEQITLMYTYELKQQQEKDIQRSIKEQMLEEAKAEREIQEQKKKIDKDLQQHLGEVNRLMKYLQKTQIEAEKQLYIDKIKELEDKIKMLESDKKAVLEREANAKAGFVYIISNIGSFGEGIYKIGMTRRLEPMDRIKELSSASVPFEFDVHAMIFSSDAPELENMLHKHFADNAVNKVNPRKEFFHVNIDDIEKIVKENYNDTVQFTKIPIATEYRQSLSIAQN